MPLFSIKGQGVRFGAGVFFEKIFRGAWCLGLGAWCLGIGDWGLVLGAWCLVLGAWCLVLGDWGLGIGDLSNLDFGVGEKL
jgi:hypothetical protein